MQTIIETYKAFGGMGYYHILFLLALVYLAFTEEDKRVRVLLVYTPAFVQLLFFAPPFFSLYSTLDRGTYYRILWLLPMTVVIAYAACRLIGKHMRLGVVLVGILLVISGKYVYDSVYITPAENPYHLPQETIELCDMIKPGPEEERIWASFPVDQVHFVRQYTTTIQMPFGRDSIVESWDRAEHPLFDLYCMAEIPADELATEATKAYCHYIVLLKTQVITGDPTAHGIEYFGETENYVVYRNTAVDFFK